MQLMASYGAEGSQDGSDVTGLDVVPGRIERLVVGPQLVLPHVDGLLYWNQSSHVLSESIPQGGDILCA